MLVARTALKWSHARGRRHLVHDRGKSLLRGVGVDRSLAASSPLVPALDAPAQEVEALIDVADPRLLFRQAQGPSERAPR
jgi:hypothetical protein